MNKYTLNFLVWFNAVAFFRHNMYRDLLLLTGNQAIAFSLSHSEAAENCDIVRLWQDYGNNEDECSQAIILYLDFYEEKYKKIA